MFFNLRNARESRTTRGELKRIALLAAASAFASSLAAGAAQGAIVQYSWTVVIDTIGPWKAPLPGMEDAKVGDKAFLTFSLDTSSSDSCAAPIHGCYATGAVNVRFWMPRIGYLYTVSAADLSVSNYSAGPGMDTIRIEAVLPGLDANFLIWLRSTDPNAITNPAVPTTINIDDFDFTQYAGFFGTTEPSSNILRGTPFPTPTCPADLNNDGYVDDVDFSLFVRGYNTLDCFDASMPTNCPADFDYDGLVDDGDFVRFVAAYNELICP